jgi:chitin synthase
MADQVELEFEQPVTWELPHSKLHYTAVKTDRPVEFSSLGYESRFAGGKKKLFIVVTIYNEEPKLLKRTLHGIAANVRTMCTKESPESWRDVVVCIVSDGRTKANPETLDYATELGIFSLAAMEKQLEASPDIGMHLFENTVEISHTDTSKSTYPPLQVMYALKESNAGKINSHWWFFEAFAPQINPGFCVLIDAGTKPDKKAIYHLYQTMYFDSRIAGCCGEITMERQLNLNPIVAAQNFEYKVANILDKTMETMFGYVSVLPGAFSAYRYEALQGAPLEKYFHHISTPLKELSPFKANMYLAEDRILCFELVSKAGCNYLLSYNNKAIAKTDAPSTVVDLIKQRRRWLNGSFFASLYALMHVGSLLSRSKHSLLRKVTVFLQYLYILITICFLWFMVANFYLIFYFSISYLFDQTELYFHAVRLVFIAFVLLQFVYGLGNRPDGNKFVYNASAVLFGMLFLVTFGLAAVALFESDQKLYLYVSAGITIGITFVAGLLHMQFFTLLGSFLQYVFFVPLFLIIMPIYSMCNLHDISWGTKSNEEAFKVEKVSEDEKEKDNARSLDERVIARLRRAAQIRANDQQDLQQIKIRFQNFRTLVLLGWIFSQGLYVSLIIYLSETGNFSKIAESFLFIVTFAVGIVNCIRLLGSIAYLFSRSLCSRSRAL